MACGVGAKVIARALVEQSQVEETAMSKLGDPEAGNAERSLQLAEQSPGTTRSTRGSARNTSIFSSKM